MNRLFRSVTFSLTVIASLCWGGAANAQTFTNSTLIDILDDQTPDGDGIVRRANPYPSPITVSGLLFPINKVTVTLHGFWHSFVRDVDILLTGPLDNPAAQTIAGRSFTILMSDVGGGNPGVPSTSPIDITFSDDGTNTFTPIDIPSSGVYKPANGAGGETPDQFPDTGLQFSNRPVSLSTFNGTNGNGVWRLYIVDDGPGDVGQIINGWSITINANIPEPTTLPLLLGGLLVSGFTVRRRRD